MKRKLIAYGLIVLGGIPVLVKIILTIMGRLDQPLVINNEKLYNFYVENGVGITIGGFFIGIIMIVIGRMMLKKDKAASLEAEDEKHLNEGERVIFRQSTQESIVTVTNQRVRYYGFFTKDIKKNVINVPETDREDYLIKDIHTVKAVTNSDILKGRIKIKGNWGIQLGMKNGAIVNIPASKNEELANRIDIVIKQS
jgi:hypothetical protein